MATYKFVEPGMGFPAIGQTGTWGTAAGQQAPAPFGLVVGAVDGTWGYGEFVFAAGSNVTAGNLVEFIGSGSVRAAGSGTASVGAVGFAPTGITATSHWGWVQVMGYFDSASHSAAAADGVAICMGTVAGALDSRSASNAPHQIYNMRNQGSNTASTPATIYLNNPWYRGF